MHYHYDGRVFRSFGALDAYLDEIGGNAERVTFCMDMRCLQREPPGDDQALPE